MTTLQTADVERLAALRRMKLLATGLLLLAAAVYVGTAQWETAGAPGWVGYLNAAAEAGLIGGLADWFAVTALFRHPLGLPIPHTAIIPRKKDQLGASLSTFVGENFLSAEQVRDKVHRAEVARSAGDWLVKEDNARRVSDEGAAWLRGGLAVLRDEDVRNALEFTVMRRLAVMDVSRPLGRMLEQVVRDRSHQGLVDLVVEQTWKWLRDNRDVVERTIAGHAPTWSPIFVDQVVTQRIYREIMRVATEVRDNPAHDTRATVDRMLLALARDMQGDPATIARVQRGKDALLVHPEARRVLDEFWASGRATLIELAEDPDSGLRTGLTEQVRSFGERLVTDEVMAAKVDTWVAGAAGHVVDRYRAQITSIISDTVEAWDAQDTAGRIELHVGRDLQFVRVNGFVVGALVGLVIHALSTLVW